MKFIKVINGLYRSENRKYEIRKLHYCWEVWEYDGKSVFSRKIVGYYNTLKEAKESI